MNYDLHPACLSVEALLAECTVRTGRRGGPGGQHRNKVETAVVIEHLPSGVRAEANERRSQAANRSAAIGRLRLKLAVQLRSGWVQRSIAAGQPDPAAHQASCPPASPGWRQRLVQGRLAVADEHPEFPALLAEALDHLAVADWNPLVVAGRLGTSGSQLVKLLRKCRPALQLCNRNRSTRGLSPLS